MICDSTNVFSVGRAGSELDVRNSLLNIIEKLNKKSHGYIFASQMLLEWIRFFIVQRKQEDKYHW